MSSIPSHLLPAFEQCRRIHKKHGKSYYFATRFFPYQKRLATYALYAFFRIPDEMVDSYGLMPAAEVKERLLKWKDEWLAVYGGEEKSGNLVLKAAAWVFHAYRIPFEYGEAFFLGMIQDTYKATYKTYSELEEYMYGSAATVGLMMSHVIGFLDPKALPHARKLGEAMQLTNFLRDIAEDWDERKRVYIPLEDLERFGVSLDDIAYHRFTPQFKECMRFEIGRADALYEEADQGISFLHVDGRFAVRAASALYREILRKIEAQDYNVFLGRARTHIGEKIGITVKAYLNM